MTVAAVIFDLDGTVLMNESDWEEAFLAVARKYQVPNAKCQMPSGWVHEPGIGVESNWKRMVGVGGEDKREEVDDGAGYFYLLVCGRRYFGGAVAAVGF
jgi:phosphoglycolate phosphatase-like HAD superfamily hydrolase